MEVGAAAIFASYTMLLVSRVLLDTVVTGVVSGTFRIHTDEC